jgi:hypothetical protein
MHNPTKATAIIIPAAVIIPPNVQKYIILSKKNKT